MTSTPTKERAEQLANLAEHQRQKCESFLLEIRADRGETAQLTIGEAERLRAMTRDYESCDRHARHYAAELARCGTVPEALQRAANGRGGRANCAALLSPSLARIGDDELRSVYGKARRGESVALESRAPGFVSADSLLPSQLFEIPTFPIHENRLLNKLPGYALEAPSLEYVQVNTITGSAAIVGEGQPKPEVDMPATKLICTALKLAVTAGISWENLTDYDAFSQAVRTELMRLVVDLENAELWGGDPAAGGLNSLTNTAGILTFAAVGTTENWTDLAGAIATLRTGAALAEPDLILMHPNSWATIRTQKDQYGRFLSTPDPTTDQAETAWGIDVLVSTQFTAGEAVLVDTSKVGRVAVRESLVLRIGYSNDDFVRNIVRSVCEERLNFAIERPAAICHVTGLPAVAPTEATPTKTTARK